MSVVVLGSINLDLIAQIDKIPVAGETRLAQELLTAPGGKGANQALAARRMGAEAILIGMVGDDVFATQALRLLRQDGVDLSHVGVSHRSSTGMALITVENSGQNAITVVPGANYELGSEALARLERLLTAEDFLVMQAEIPFEVIERAVIIARRAESQILWDPAPASPHFPRSLFHVDVIAPNQAEAGLLLGTTIDDVRSAKAAARQLRTLGAHIAIVKLGAQGLVWATSRGVFYEPGIEVNAVDAVGAGDVFLGALAARLAAKDSWTQAIKMANRAAALSTTQKGAQPSFPWLGDVRKMK
ncbi:MAG: ribokinase [Firmicutes bacterium]|jgi:ribokinase|uniref:Ribokinase n=1 Tax=Sulfobacillus benefaciens TaxID=453960 RepID=A0A2T2WQF3_9FIRM|nr:ribokinase [Bacillota bacterium]MCL5015010.1 ribokinase [Bacillota bacterium]PSR24460.1 MAG: ribokinase [Sulfobacillus benefaciens]